MLKKWYRGRGARQRSAKPPTPLRLCSVPHNPALRDFFVMLTQQEEDFIRYWSDQRLRKKQFLRKFSIGMPLGVMIAVALLINFLSGWYKKADMVLHSDTSVIFVVLIAIIGIVVFITIFSAHHKWDQNELYYNELLYKKDQESASDAAE